MAWRINEIGLNFFLNQDKANPRRFLWNSLKYASELNYKPLGVLEVPKQGFSHLMNN